MRMTLVCVLDKATQQFGNPFVVVNKGQALRTFGDEVQSSNPDNQIAKHPDDFELYFLGHYETDNASFELVDVPERISRGTDFVKQ